MPFVELSLASLSVLARSVCRHRGCVFAQVGGVWYAQGGARSTIADSGHPRDDHPHHCWSHDDWAEAYERISMGLSNQDRRNPLVPTGFAYGEVSGPLSRRYNVMINIVRLVILSLHGPSLYELHGRRDVSQSPEMGGSQTRGQSPETALRVAHLQRTAAFFCGTTRGIARIISLPRRDQQLEGRLG